MKDELTWRQRRMIELLPSNDFNVPKAAAAAGYGPEYCQELPYRIRRATNGRLKLMGEAITHKMAESIPPVDTDESERIRKKVMKDLEHISNSSLSDAVRVKALELMGKTIGLFIDRSEHNIGWKPGEFGDADRARERMRVYVESQRKQSLTEGRGG